MGLYSRKKPKLILIVILLVTALSGCLNRGLSPLDDLIAKGPESENTAATVSAGDILRVEVWGEPRLSGEIAVRDDGLITMPLVNDVSVVGKTPSAVSTEITNKLKDFVTGASVTVTITASSPIRYYLQGAFMKPGEYRNDKRVTLLQAIASGGGFAPFADESNVLLIRQGLNGEMRYKLDYNRVLDGREPNPQLKNGDVVAIR